MPEYTLRYFNMHGRGSAMCHMLAKAGADWEKVGLSGDEWKALKPTLPAGTGMPLVTLADGTILYESIPTSRFIAQKFGFYPEDPLTAWRTDVVSA